MRVIVLDIETIPLPESCLIETDDVIPMLQRIACISYAEMTTSLEVVAVRTLGAPLMSERKALRELADVINSDTLVVTWGGRFFDIPVLIYRSMVYGIQVPHMLTGEFPKRFSSYGHTDLQDEMSFFGSVRRARLDYAAAVFGLPGKLDVRAAEVQELIARNRFEEVRSYCVTDVVQTAVIFTKWMHAKGEISDEELNASISSWEDPSIYEEGSTSERTGVLLVKESCNWNALKVG